MKSNKYALLTCFFLCWLLTPSVLKHNVCLFLYIFPSFIFNFPSCWQVSVENNHSCSHCQQQDFLQSRNTNSAGRAFCLWLHVKLGAFWTFSILFFSCEMDKLCRFTFLYILLENTLNHRYILWVIEIRYIIFLDKYVASWCICVMIWGVNTIMY